MAKQRVGSMKTKEQTLRLIHELKQISSQCIHENDVATQKRIKIITEIEEDLHAIPDFLWDSMSPIDFEVSSNQYSMF